MAVTITAGTLRERLGIDDTLAGLEESMRLREIVTALVNRYADAPEAIANEAAIRTAAYLRASKPQGLALRKLDLGEAGVTIEVRSAGSALRLSGAAALLSPWRVRRAMAAVEATS